MREIRFQRNGSLHTAVNRQRPKSSLGSEGGVDGSIFYIYPEAVGKGKRSGYAEAAPGGLPPRICFSIPVQKPVPRASAKD